MGRDRQLEGAPAIADNDSDELGDLEGIGDGPVLNADGSPATKAVERALRSMVKRARASGIDPDFSISKLKRELGIKSRP